MTRSANPYEVKVVDWTILPAKVTARAWIDDEFRAELLARPDDVLRREVKQWTHEISFVVHSDESKIRNLPLPAWKPEFDEWPPGALAERLAKETDDDDSLRYQLPARVILRALTDHDYRRKLVSEPPAALADEGITVEETFRIHENRLGAYHLALPLSPADAAATDLEELRNQLNSEFGTGTTRCCATGTCT